MESTWGLRQNAFIIIKLLLRDAVFDLLFLFSVFLLVTFIPGSALFIHLYIVAAAGQDPGRRKKGTLPAMRVTMNVSYINFRWNIPENKTCDITKP